MSPKTKYIVLPITMYLVFGDIRFYLPVKIASCYVCSFWQNTGIWQTHRLKCY